MDLISIVLLVAYASLLLDLTVFPIPSEASTFQLLTRADPADDVSAAPRDALARARRRSRPWKVVLYLLPTGLGVALFLIPLVAAFAPEVIAYLWPIRALESPVVRGAGAILLAAGRLTTFVSVLQLRARTRSRSPALQPRGLFRLSRNPGLVGMYAFYLGTCLIFPCVALFAGFAPYVLNMHRRVLMEESHLTRRWGRSYREYRGRVPRYLFF